MSTVTVTYPATPHQVDDAITQPSTAFRNEVFKVLYAIIFFMVVYLFLVAAALALAGLCAAGGFLLVVNLPRFFTLMIGIGLIGLGALVVFFLLKFMFKRNKTDRSHLIEITEKDQPELFAFIRTLTRETQAPFPKKIYLSPEVNACVFYDSSFWSMFFPVRKNLQIGLGLVNCVNLSEFKAILAHEFGHFSQRSMKLGSYVYNVNQIIYNLLYDNEGFGKTLEGFASVSGYFAFFANLTINIIMGIQWILQKVYAIVNKSYMSLSRQMEFHADSVAAAVSGSDHLITSLRRLEVADSCYNRLFEYYNLWYKRNLKPDNIYPHHTEVMKQFAEEQGISMCDGLPQIDAGTFASYNKTRIVVKDQWASHPSTDDREKHLRKLNLITEPVKASAWSIFRNPEGLQKNVTEKIYSGVAFKAAPQSLDFHSFKQHYKTEVEKYKIDKRYKGYFNFRNITSMDLRNIEGQARNSLEDVLNEDAVSLPYTINGLHEDLQVLENIRSGSLPVKTFEFDGKRFKKADAINLSSQLKQELDSAEMTLAGVDKQIIGYFLKAAEKFNEKESLRQQYSEFFQFVESGEKNLACYAEMMEDTRPLYYGNLEVNDVNQIMHKIKLNESLLKDNFRNFIRDSSNDIFLDDEDRQKAETYLDKDHVYFNSAGFNEEALTLFNEATAIFAQAIQEKIFHMKKTILEKQLGYI